MSDKISMSMNRYPVILSLLYLLSLIFLLLSLSFSFILPVIHSVITGIIFAADAVDMLFPNSTSFMCSRAAGVETTDLFAFVNLFP